VTDKDLYGGMIRLHILHHAAKEPVFGLGIIEELRHHGYQLSPYPQTGWTGKSLFRLNVQLPGL
jgi:hypothetical protein